jgi:hypothetical protein
MITQDMSSRIDKMLEKKSNPADIKFKTITESSYDGDQRNRFESDESLLFPKPTLEQWNSVVPKKIEPQVVDTKAEVISTPPGEKFISNNAKKEKVKALKEMESLIKNGSGGKSMSFTTVKKPIDEIYDCIIVEKGIPVESDRIYYGANNRIAFWDRDDASVYYANLDNKYYRFANSKEFHKFCKDNNIK